MNIESMEILGLIAGACTTASFVPQVLHTWRTKSVEDISLRMYLMFCTGILLWLVYGILIGSLSIVLANFVCVILAGAVVVMKIKYGNLQKPKENTPPEL